MISLHNVEKIANFYSVAFRMIASNTKDLHQNFNIETFETSPSNKELTVSSLALAKTIASTQCTYPRRDGRLS